MIMVADLSADNIRCKHDADMSHASLLRGVDRYVIAHSLNTAS